MTENESYKQLVYNYQNNKATDKELEVFFKLLEEGKLKNIGKRMQPIYVASAGYYGVSRDVLRR